VKGKVILAQSIPFEKQMESYIGSL